MNETSLSPFALIALANNQDLAQFLDEQIQGLQEYLMGLDTLEAQDEIIETTRKMQIFQAIKDEIADFGVSAKEQLEEGNE